jgi:hypothetical protein
LQDRDARFDVIGVSPDGRGFACELVQDAFAAFAEVGDASYCAVGTRCAASPGRK